MRNEGAVAIDLMSLLTKVKSKGDRVRRDETTPSVSVLDGAPLD